MARVKQFADDLGISKNQAQALINKGRSRKDGGSQILESVMNKPIKASKGKKVVLPTNKPNRMFSNDAEAAKKNTVNKLKTMGVLPRKDNTTKDKTESLDKEFSRKVFEANQKAMKEAGETRKKANPISKRKAGGQENFGMLSVKAGIDNNPNATQADRISGATKNLRGGGIAIQGLGFRGVK
jgi:hypothetical protein